ncbi:MAG: beta-lactamase family protein [Actinobacteria bacterium]|nr:beta-lactamase family protein [Actinomycetota bacterium]
MAEIRGFANGPYERLADVLSATLDDGSDLGASVAVTVDGEFVADFWGGWADADRTTPWQQDTIVNTWSTTKTMTGLVALMLVDRGLVDPDAPVATYWPEFAQNGKEGVLVRHVLSHTSGVCGWEQPVVQEDVYDQDKSAKILAAQAPWFAPGSVVGYQALVHGHLVGEVVRRVTGRSLGTFFAEEVAGPLGADFHIGLAPEHDARVTPVLPPPPLPFDFATLDPASPMYKTFTGPPVGADFANTAEWRRAEIGGANGHGNARSVARVQSVVANGGALDGVRLLSPETVDRIFAVQAEGVDVVLGVPVRHGLGYGLPSETVPYVADNGRVCFWGGWGGSMVVVDAARRTVFSYMMNKMAPGVVGGPTAEKLLTVFNTI